MAGRDAVVVMPTGAIRLFLEDQTDELTGLDTCRRRKVAHLSDPSPPLPRVNCRNHASHFADV